MNQLEQTENKKKSVWEIILKIIIAVASGIAGALGVTACVGWTEVYHLLSSIVQLPV